MKRISVVIIAILTICAVRAATPDWVKAKPSSLIYYTGVASAPVSDPDHKETAKRLALSDIASEISVEIESNSLMLREETNSQFNESFRQDIKTRAEAELEGYEFVDSYNDGQRYWVYYQLDQQFYAELVAQRKIEATAKGLDFLTKGKQAMQQGFAANTIDLYAEGLKAVSSYVNQRLMTNIDNREIDVVTELYLSLSSALDHFTISAMPEIIQVTSFNGEVHTIDVLAMLNGISAQGIKINANFTSGDGTFGSIPATDQSGHSVIKVLRISSKSTQQEITISPAFDFSALESDKLLAPFASKLHAKIPSANVRLEISANDVLKAYIDSYGSLGMSFHNGLNTILNQQYFDVVESEEDADVKILIKSSLRKGGTIRGEAYNMTEAFANATITITDLSNNRILTTLNISDFRILSPENDSQAQLYAKAAREAIKRLKPIMANKFKELNISKK